MTHDVPHAESQPDPERAPEASPPSHDPALPDGKPVIIARYHTEQEAHLAASRFQAMGIRAMVEASSVVRGFEAPFAAMPLGIGVMVPEDQAGDALAILDSGDFVAK